MHCPFCDIDTTKTRVIKEGLLAYVCLSNPRLMTGHLLVIPKRHLENIAEITQEERDEIFNLLVEFEKKILKRIAARCDIRQNYRPFIKQNRVKVSHLHFHLQPRKLEDKLSQTTQKNELWEDLSEEDLNKSIKLIKN